MNGRYLEINIKFLAQRLNYCSLPAYASTLIFNLCPGRNVTTFLAEIGISSPVLGFRPGLSAFDRVRKLPNPDNFTW
jgi:hypothetical protein